MSGLSRGGVALNLIESPYRFCVSYCDGSSRYNSITYVFSSDFYKQNFIRKYKGNRKKINESLSNRFGFEIMQDVICDLKLYSGIEKRGFLVYQNGERIECLKSIRLDGKNLIRTI